MRFGFDLCENEFGKSCRARTWILCSRPARKILHSDALRGQLRRLRQRTRAAAGALSRTCPDLRIQQVIAAGNNG
jgi:hypothetical protein